MVGAARSCGSACCATGAHVVLAGRRLQDELWTVTAEAGGWAGSHDPYARGEGAGSLGQQKSSAGMRFGFKALFSFQKKL